MLTGVFFTPGLTSTGTPRGQSERAQRPCDRGRGRQGGAGCCSDLASWFTSGVKLRAQDSRDHVLPLLLKPSPAEES